MKVVLFFSIFFVALNVSAQKIDVDKKTNMVSVDGTEVFTIEDQNFGNTYTVKNLKGERLALVQRYDYIDNNRVSSSNPSGKVYFMEITFMNTELSKCETMDVGFKKQISKMLIENELIIDGVLQEDKIKQFVAINGNKYSELRGNNTIIIVK